MDDESDCAEETMDSDLSRPKIELHLASKPKGILKMTTNIVADRSELANCKSATFDEQNVLKT